MAGHNCFEMLALRCRQCKLDTFQQLTLTAKALNQVTLGLNEFSAFDRAVHQEIIGHLNHAH